MYKNLAATLVAACVIAPSLAQTAASQKTTTPPVQPLKAAFVYVTPVLPAGWTRQHEEGRLQVQRTLGDSVHTTAVENVPEGPDAERVLRDLVAQGNQLIFTTSFGYMEPTLRVAREFPGVKFENITGYKQAANVATANARYYEGRYLSGIAAGRVSKTGVAGFVAGFPIPEVLQGINAFTLGMRSVNPKAQVKVVWLNTWFDPALERDAAMTLMDQGADVLSFQVASTAVMVAAQERGKMAVAYHSDMRKDAPDAQLMAVTHPWGSYYTARAKAVQNQTWKSGDVWGGIQQGMIKVEHFGPKLPQAVRDEVMVRQKEIAQGRLQPFQAVKAPLRDNQGRERVPLGGQLSDAQLHQMDWLVEGVIGSTK